MVRSKLLVIALKIDYSSSLAIVFLMLDAIEFRLSRRQNNSSAGLCSVYQALGRRQDLSIANPFQWHFGHFSEPFPLHVLRLGTGIRLLSQHNFRRAVRGNFLTGFRLVRENAAFAGSEDQPYLLQSARTICQTRGWSQGFFAYFSA